MIPSILICVTRIAAKQYYVFCSATRRPTSWKRKHGNPSLHFKGVTAMFLTHIAHVYRQWRRYNQSLRELNRLGDRELADLGISRSDIPRVAWESSEH